jgi:hypothetical protein
MLGLSGLVSDSLGNCFLAGTAIVAVSTLGYTFWRTIWKNRQQRHDYTQRQRERRKAWGWE